MGPSSIHSPALTSHSVRVCCANKVEVCRRFVKVVTGICQCCKILIFYWKTLSFVFIEPEKLEYQAFKLKDSTRCLSMHCETTWIFLENSWIHPPYMALPTLTMPPQKQEKNSDSSR